MKFLLDDFDKKLLSLIQQNANLSQQELGERINLSATAVNRRLKSLTEKGIIENYTVQLNPSLLGLSLTIIVEIQVEREHKNLLNEIQSSFLACPQVQQCYYVAGECDFVLIMLVQNMEEYVQLAETLFQDNPNIKSYKTLTVMKRIKASMDLPLGDNLVD